jgi:hypothetical protein
LISLRVSNPPSLALCGTDDKKSLFDLLEGIGSFRVGFAEVPSLARDDVGVRVAEATPLDGTTVPRTFRGLELWHVVEVWWGVSRVLKKVLRKVFYVLGKVRERERAS